MRKQIVPSIIAKSQGELDKRISKVKNDFSLLQLDVMDGKFVKNKSFDFDFKVPRGLRYEAQLMIMNPVSWIEAHSSKVDVIIFHIEPVRKDVRKIVKLIRDKKKGVGIAIKPRTKISEVKPYLKLVDMILVMTVNPGSYGGKFLSSALKKVELLREQNPGLNIEVDGGISDETIALANASGANMFVSGSYLQESKNMGKSLAFLELQLGQSAEREVSDGS